MKHHRLMATNGRLDQETVWFVERLRISAKKWKTTFFSETTLDLPTMIGGPRNRKWQRCKHRIGKVTRKWWGFGSNMGYPHMQTLGWHSTHPTNGGKPTSRHTQLPDMVKTLQRSQIVLKKNPVAGRLVCNFFAPGRRFKRTWTLWSTRPGNTEPSWGHCSINPMDVPRLAASNKISPGMMKDSFTGLV